MRSRLYAATQGTPIPTAWSLNGNPGSGLLLGTLTLNAFNFIVGGITRAVMRADGARTLSSHGVASAYTEMVEKTLIGTTTNGLPSLMFSLPITDQSVWKFSADFQARRSSGIDRAAYERKVLCWREGGNVILGRQHSPFTDESSTDYNLYWQANTTNMELYVQGLPGHTIYWSGTVKYQGVNQL